MAKDPGKVPRHSYVLKAAHTIEVCRGQQERDLGSTEQAWTNLAYNYQCRANPLENQQWMPSCCLQRASTRASQDRT